MTVPATILRRLEELESDALRQRQALAQGGGRAARAAAPRDVYLARTIKVECDYPASGDTFGLVFVDREFVPSAGEQDVIDHDRSRCHQAIGRTIDGQYLSEGTFCVAMYSPAPPGTSGKGHWHIIDYVLEDGVPATSTTTTPEPQCTGRCHWDWSAVNGYWTLANDGCAETTTSTTSTTTGDPQTSTTTTANPCCASSTTSTTSTTTPEPTCNCLPPRFCGSADGDCTFTFCASGSVEEEIDCTSTTSTTSTTTPNPASTTTCDCNTTTTAAPPPGCTAGCDWAWLPGTGGLFGWRQTGGSCAASCPCPAPVDPGGACETAHTLCQPTTTPAPPPPPPCTGDCTYWWIPLYGQWWRTSKDCAAVSFCDCVPPSADGSACAPVKVPCHIPPAHTTTPAPTLPAGPCANCYPTTTSTSTTSTSTTTPAPCQSDCLWRSSGSAWTIVDDPCGLTCDCPEPSYAPDGACSELAESPCGSTTTSTTSTSTTTTTTTSTTTTSTTTTTTTTTTSTTTPCPTGYTWCDGVPVPEEGSCCEDGSQTCCGGVCCLNCCVDTCCDAAGYSCLDGLCVEDTSTTSTTCPPGDECGAVCCDSGVGDSCCDAASNLCCLGGVESCCHGMTCCNDATQDCCDDGTCASHGACPTTTTANPCDPDYTYCTTIDDTPICCSDLTQDCCCPDGCYGWGTGPCGGCSAGYTGCGCGSCCDDATETCNSGTGSCEPI